MYDREPKCKRAKNEKARVFVAVGGCEGGGDVLMASAHAIAVAETVNLAPLQSYNATTGRYADYSLSQSVGTTLAYSTGRDLPLDDWESQATKCLIFNEHDLLPCATRDFRLRVHA